MVLNEGLAMRSDPHRIEVVEPPPPQWIGSRIRHGGEHPPPQPTQIGSKPTK